MSNSRRRRIQSINLSTPPGSLPRIRSQRSKSPMFLRLLLGAPIAWPISATCPLSLFDIWIHIIPFLHRRTRPVIYTLDSAFSSGVLYSHHLLITRPWQPIHRRRYGSGGISRARSATTTAPTFLHIFHHLWPFLLPSDRLTCHRSCPATLRYSYQRAHAALNSISSLRAPRPSPTKPIHIDQPRTRLFGSALLRFDFVY